MTLTDYLNQEDPQRLSSGTVVLQDSEIQIVRRMERKNHFSYTMVYVPSVGYGYMIIDGSNVLRTVDQDGNPKGWSCFSYELPKA